jgi:hypothetical protein
MSEPSFYDTIDPPVPEESPIVVVEPTPPVVEEPSPYLMTLDELLNSRDVMMARETSDRQTIQYIESPDPIMLRRKLLEWAAAGFPDAFPIFNITVSPPEVCSDGVARGLYDYIKFVSGQTLAEKMKVLESKLKGISVVNSFSGSTITIHVMKAPQ